MCQVCDGAMKDKNKKNVDEIISIIKKTNPLKVYLFGSYVTSEFDDESDIDLLVVANSNDRPLERRLKLRRMLMEYDRRIGLDILVYTPAEFEMLRKEPSSFLSSAVKRGIVIYDGEAP